MKKYLKYVGYTLIAAFIVIQFIRIDKANPAVVAGEDLFDVVDAPENVRTLISTACYDCHSHLTVYPWYSNIAPFSWILADHIEEGREHLNFSKWGNYSADKQDHKLEECAEEVEEGEMPMEAYTYLHGEADLTDDDRELLENWFESLRKP